MEELSLVLSILSISLSLLFFIFLYDDYKYLLKSFKNFKDEFEEMSEKLHKVRCGYVSYEQMQRELQRCSIRNGEKPYAEIEHRIDELSSRVNSLFASRKVLYMVCSALIDELSVIKQKLKGVKNDE